MTRSHFLTDRRPTWRHFEDLLFKAEAVGKRSMTGEEIASFSRLFRSVSYDLTLVRSRDWGQGLERYLNDLVNRAHNAFYRAPPAQSRHIIGFFTRGFPRLFRAEIAYFWTAFALFTVPGLISGIAVWIDPTLVSRILPQEMLDMLDQMYSGEPRESGTGMEAAMTGFYVRNNIGIAFRCFATGIFFGLGSVFFLIYNSIFFGTVVSYMLLQGHSERFFSFVVSHGSFELTAIVISGAGGLILGHALVHPGPYERSEALRQRGLVGVRLAAGAGAMLAVAAFIEAFWSPSGAPGTLKYLVGTLLWGVVIAYLTLAGRTEKSG